MMFGSGESASKESQDSTVRNDEDATTGVKFGDVVESGQRALLSRFGGFETRRTPTGFEPAGPRGLDLVSRQSLPFTGVVLAPTRVDTACRTGGDLGQEIRGDTSAFEVARNHEIERWTFRGDQGSGLSCLQSTECRERGIGLSLPPADGIPFALSVSYDENSGDGVGHDRSRYPRYASDVVTLRLFAQAREVAGTSRDSIPGSTVAEVVEAARQKYGERFSALLPTCRVWLNGEEVAPSTTVADDDEVAVLPPVSGGCR